MKMQVDDPPYLSVGTAVSAKYKGAFCEAKVSKVVRIVKCKVTYKMGLGTDTVSDDQIKGTLRVGQTVQAKHPTKKEFVEAAITKIQDCSQYTVVFDDGDITTLRRTALCLKSGRHFNESETLDQLPLTHPEHFGNPVVGGRRGRRYRQLKDDSSDGEPEEENEPDLEGYVGDIGRVVAVEMTDKKRGRDNWFPALVVIPSAQPTVRINVKDEYLIRSFKDGRYYTVPKKEVSDFNKNMGEKSDSAILSEAVSKAVKYLDNNELPVHWERRSLFNMQSIDTDSDENFSDSSDDEPCEEKDRFVAQLYKYNDDARTPLNKSPTVAGQDVDLYRLFSIVNKFGGYNKVTNMSKWRSVTIRLKFPNNQNTTNQVKQAYKKCLLNYEIFHRTLGVTMLNHTRSTKKNKGRSLIRDRDRATPVNSPRPDKEDEIEIKKEEEKVEIVIKEKIVVEEKTPTKKRVETKKEEEKKRKESIEHSDAYSSDAAEPQEPLVPPPVVKEVGRPKRAETRLTSTLTKEKKIVKAGLSGGDKVKAIVEKFEEQTKKEEDKQQTRSKTQIPKSKDVAITNVAVEKKVENKTPAVAPKETKEAVVVKSQPPKIPKKIEVEEKKRGRKRTLTEEKPIVHHVTADTPVPVAPSRSINVGDKLKVFYGPTNESKVTYEAKVVEVDSDHLGVLYLVHYTGWNTRYDEWIRPARIAENLSSTKAKRLKAGAANKASTSANMPPMPSTSNKPPGRRGRLASITGKTSTPSTSTDVPRSTTPSSTTSTSSRTKSPATPATRSTNRVTRQDYTRRTRRTSGQTDVSMHSGSDSDGSDSEPELMRTRSGNKSDEVEVVRTYMKRTPRSTARSFKIKENDEDTEKEEEPPTSVERPKRIIRKLRRFIDKSADESDEECATKGRDFDLNQIRSELKGFAKTVPSSLPPVDSADKEESSSSDESADEPPKLDEEEAEEKPEPKCETPEKSPSSEDVYEFKEPEPFEFESRPKITDEKTKKRLPRIYEELEKSSPKSKSSKSPSKNEKETEVEKKTYKRTPVKKIEISDDESEVKEEKDKKDPFDRLMESSSYGLSAEKQEGVEVPETKPTASKSLLNEQMPLSLFRELPETADEYSRDMELSDTESQTQPIFTRGDEIFSDTFTKSPSDWKTLDLEFSYGRNAGEEAAIKASIQRVIAQTSSTDEESSDAILSSGFETKPQGAFELIQEAASLSDIKEVIEEEDKEKEKVPEKSAFQAIKQMSSSLNSDRDMLSNMSQTIGIQTTIVPSVQVDEKESISTKAVTTILQKFEGIQTKLEIKSPVKEEEEKKVIVESEVKEEVAHASLIPDMKNPLESPPIPMPSPTCQKSITPPRSEPLPHLDLQSDVKKRRNKVISKPFIDSDSDSSGCENLVIAPSDDEDDDDDSRSDSMLDKPDIKDSDSNMSTTQTGNTDESQSQEEERNFKIENIVKKLEESEIENTESPKPEPEAKEEEPDTNLLLCEETIPRSPAPLLEENVLETEPPRRSKSAMEMPFASAPSGSNNKNMLLGSTEQQKQSKAPVPPPLVIPPIIDVIREDRDVSTVLENTPPTTPDSASILSARGDDCSLSPNIQDHDNDSCKSNDLDNDYLQQRKFANKVSPYSEEDTQMTNEGMSKKLRDETLLQIPRKRKKSYRGSDETSSSLKRGRKPLNRSRHNSDSDENSDHSLDNITNIGTSTSYDRSTRSPRPSKYNFFVEFDPSLDSSQRIAVLQQKLTDLRKTYADIKAELAAVERRRKKIRRREREGLFEKEARGELEDDSLYSALLFRRGLFLPP